VTPYFLILALLLALAPAVIAHGKGRNFLLWWLYGVVLGPVALIHSILLRSARRPIRDLEPEERDRSWSSPWPLLLRVAASLAIAVVAVAVYRFFVPPEFDKAADRREVAVSTDRTPPAQSSPVAPAGDADRLVKGEPAAAKAPEPAAAAPSPTVNVTVRPEGEAANAETARAEAAKEPAAAKPADSSEAKPADPADKAAPTPETGAPAPDTTAAVPPPPPPPPAKRSDGQLERTVPLERTIAEKPAPEPAKKSTDSPPATKDVDTLAARTAPPEDARSAQPDPVVAPTPRDDTLRREQDEQPARRKPAARKAAAPKPAPAPAPAPSDVTAVGDTVRVVQQALAERGYDPGPANGRAGRQTEQAIRKFQEDRGLNPTGSIDYSVLETLNIVGPRVHAFQPPPGTAPGR
jgi:hypothetical protein